MLQPSHLHVHEDSGPPEGSTDYTTFILVHGYAWHSGIFSKLVPLSRTYNVRVVLVNRRDYPGAVPYSEGDRAALDVAAAQVESDAAAAQTNVLWFMKDNARDLYDFLTGFVKENDIPQASVEQNSGGIIVSGWSFAGGWMTALLAYADSFPAGDIDLGAYLRRVILYDVPYHTLGYPPLNGDTYGNPLFDASLAPDDRTRVFADWVSGYFRQTDDLDDLDRRTWLAHPPPTISTMTAEELALALYPSPGDPGGSDCVLMNTGIQSGAFRALRTNALRLPAQGEASVNGDGGPTKTRWAGVEVLFVWCDATPWECTWAYYALKEEVQEARKAGDKLRKVTFARVRNANHFVHWDRPDDFLRACLAETSELEDVVVGSA